ncbi:MAG: HU family DNA-binding protein, partial [Acetobacteraceae bacterium]|nr:HU family DNA-binding protein [Acetobacteraceae bacterium]
MPAKRASTAATRAPRAANKTSASPASKAANAGTASKSSGASPTVTLRHLAVQIAEQHEMSKKMADAVLANMVNLMVKHLKKGDRVRIGGLGILQVKKRAARMGRNPATGEAIKIKASKKVAFRAAKE